MDSQAIRRFLLPILLCLYIHMTPAPSASVITEESTDLKAETVDAEIVNVSRLNATVSSAIYNATQVVSVTPLDGNIGLTEPITDLVRLSNDKSGISKFEGETKLPMKLLSVKLDNSSTFASESSSTAIYKSFLLSNFTDGTTLSTEDTWPMNSETYTESTYETHYDSETTTDVTPSSTLEDTTIFADGSVLLHKETTSQFLDKENSVSVSNGSTNYLTHSQPSTTESFFLKHNYGAEYRALYDPKYSSSTLENTTILTSEPTPLHQKTTSQFIATEDSVSASSTNGLTYSLASTTTNQFLKQNYSAKYRALYDPTYFNNKTAVPKSSTSKVMISSSSEDSQNPTTKAINLHYVQNVSVPSLKALSVNAIENHSTSLTDSDKQMPSFTSNENNPTTLSDEKSFTPLSTLLPNEHEHLSSATLTIMPLNNTTPSNSTMPQFTSYTPSIDANSSTEGSTWPKDAFSNFIDSMKNYNQSGANKNGFDYSKYNTKPGTFTSTVGPFMTEPPTSPPDDTSRRHGRISTAMITGLVLSAILLVTCVISSIFVVQWYHHRRLRDDSMSLMSGRHGNRRPYYYYDTTM